MKRAVLLIVGILVGLVGYWFAQTQLLEIRFRDIHPDDTEARLLAVVGKPSEIRRCDEGTYKVVSDNQAVGNRCAKVYWYSTWPLADGWLVPIDESGIVMQIRRLGLP